MAAFPFPIPDASLTAEKTRVTFAFPPASLYPTTAMTAKTRIAPGALERDEKEPLFRVPAWIPVPVEGAAYFVVGALIGTLLMMTMIALVAPLRPTPPEAATRRTVESGVRQVGIVGPTTGAHRAPAQTSEASLSTAAPSLPARTAARLPSPAARLGPLRR